jgi:ArsR family transcriptional regulator
MKNMKSEKQAAKPSKRLERLICSGLVPLKELNEYMAELRKTAADSVAPGVLERQSNLLKALGDETRLKMLRLLGLREMCVCELTVALSMTQPTVSHHLNILKNAGLLKDRKEGTWTFYRAASNKVIKQLFAFLNSVSQNGH